MLPSIAHAGGAVGGVSLTNSIEALDANRDKYEVFEIDFMWTADRRLICLHDWEEGFADRFGYFPESPVTSAEFEMLLEDGGLQNCTIETLAKWMKANPSKRIVTDIKDDNLQGLTLISELYPELRDQFIPQAYQPEEIRSIKALGFRDVIWTLYRYGGKSSEVLEHLKNNPVFALTMPKERALAGEAWAPLDAGIPVQSYVHTINSEAEAVCFTGVGIDGIYTDFLGGDFPKDRAGDWCKWMFR